MSWPMQAPGAWNAGMAMAPDVNMGSYTPEQWAAMQQQNWQQWAQWQQQYAQWQSQYGEKYAQQMQAMQTMGGMPPLPPGNAVPPAPPGPPPDQPPPPPPHENNQPLYGNAQSKPTPVPPPQNKASNPSNLTSVNITTGNNQWSYSNEARPDAPQAPAVNSEALKKLAEEERLFDIQFQKWEEEIEKWKRENVNHPDKQAYKEYEQKFESCRAQLLERRQQMKQKRARLMSNAPGNVPTGNTSTAIPPPIQTPSSNYSQNQNYQKQDQSYPKQNTSMYHQPQQYNKTDTQYNQPPPSGTYNKGAVDPQDRFESYDNIEDYSANENYSPDKSSFLPTSASDKGIPGLDLVPDAEKPKAMPAQDVIDITEENTDNYQPHHQKAPDYSTISKGINNILGDEKIMNILSMVQKQVVPGNGNQNAATNAPYNQNAPPNNQWDRNDNNYNNQHYGDNRQNMPYNNMANRQDPYINMPNRQEPYNNMQNRQDSYNNMPNRQDSYNNMQNRQDSFNNMPNRQDSYNNMPNRQGQNYSMQQNQGQNNRYPPMNNQTRMYNDGQSNDDQYYDENSQYGGQDSNMPQGNVPPPRQNAPRPLMDVPVHPNVNFPRGPPNRGLPDMSVRPPDPPRPKWVEEPLFTPSIIVEYEHKPLRLKARDFIEPVHMFDYNHTSKDGENKKKDFEKEADELFSRKPRRERDDVPEKYARDLYSRDFERRVPREDVRDDYRHRGPREEFDFRRRPDDRHDDRRRDDRDRYMRRDDTRDSVRDRDRERERERDRDRDLYRDRFRDIPRRDEALRSRSRDRDSRKREHSRESDATDISKRSRDKIDSSKHVVMIDDILEPPGREIRPAKIVIILRGLPGSGKSYLAKLIRDREAEYGGTVRIMSIDDYFMQEGEIEEKDPATGKIVKKPTLKYEYDESLEETYLNSLKRAFKRSLTDGYFTFLIYDAVNDHLKSYADVWNLARQNGFQVYVCTMDLDVQTCHKRNIHGRSLTDVEVIAARFFPTPPHHIQLDPTTLLQSAAIPDVQMEDADDGVVMEHAGDERITKVLRWCQSQVENVFTSKWEKMDDAAQLARLDGTSKPLRPSQLSMEDYLQLDEWKPNIAKPGKKTVRWADIEERRQQEKMRAIGFVVGQTDWNRMTDPTMGSSALTQTKYIERVRRT